MNRVLSRGMRLAFGAAMLAATGLGVSTAVAKPAPASEEALRCPPRYNKCVCDGREYCSMTVCPSCP